ncbi:hypothetical protein SAMN05216490_2773 [Mucilaginibacter mallensis]|uniref:DUF4468 domain-containing protein n=1 Tax=Mucilaginibacter mallensis TaxID=652787 RepID=A0A1H1YL64_MUCMA|nr:hypothetical protein [Mucilaginibacter mallensis]SDT22075.1 hypothetical protein SAMN05216490_2773 [Mucilaginibacter mallensis]
MKTLFLSFAFILLAFAARCQGNTANPDSVSLRVDGTNAYYQKTVKVDSSIMESMIYLRSLEFFAAKNFQQNYGFDQEGKLICTTAQDLNTNKVYVGDEGDNVDPYTVQFSITIDMKNRRYRYTINNVVFYMPTETGNRRLGLYDMYLKATNTQSKRVARDAKKVLDSFERYIASLTGELYQAVEKKGAIDSTKF